MKNRKKILVAASIAGLMASSSIALAGPSFPGHDMSDRHCSGMNSCKGKAACKGDKNACSGHNNGCKSNCKTNFNTKVENGKLTGK